MTATTPHEPGRPDPDSAPLPTGETVAGSGRVRLSTWLWRWVLAPRTTWQARRLAADFGPGMDGHTAWVMARLVRHPDEHGYAMHHLDPVKKPPRDE
ncbi:hypothetical protein ACFWNK_38195 [Streptomyces sp. NPDC058417]|uniref:hypothetical protein n=1 Tax=unclassified Streptomyces TaxID=2593676 RepID=UPI003655E44D